jgi:hypothetical protein
MIPRYQKIIFAVLICASLTMGFLLWQLRNRAQKRMEAGDDAVSIETPATAPAESATLVVADDNANSLTAQLRSLPLPEDQGARARAILGKLLDLYASGDSAHPVPGGAAGVTQVFLVPLPPANSTATTFKPSSDSSAGPLLAVVSLTGAFVAAHPSGIETESLTVLSIGATLKANLPRIQQVRFLVDGVERPTLAGHADLTRTYLPEAPAANPGR